MKNSCPQLDSNPGPSAYEAKSLSIALLGQIFMEHLNVDRILPECDIKTCSKCSTYMVDVVKCFVVYCILLTLCSHQASYQSDGKTIQIILLYLPPATGKFK